MVSCPSTIYHFPCTLSDSTVITFRGEYEHCESGLQQMLKALLVSVGPVGPRGSEADPSRERGTHVGAGVGRIRAVRPTDNGPRGAGEEGCREATALPAEQNEATPGGDGRGLGQDVGVPPEVVEAEDRLHPTHGRQDNVVRGEESATGLGATAQADPHGVAVDLSAEAEEVNGGHCLEVELVALESGEAELDPPPEGGVDVTGEVAALHPSVGDVQAVPGNSTPQGEAPGALPGGSSHSLVGGLLGGVGDGLDRHHPVHQLEELGGHLVHQTPRREVAFQGRNATLGLDAARRRGGELCVDLGQAGRDRPVGGGQGGIHVRLGHPRTGGCHHRVRRVHAVGAEGGLFGPEGRAEGAALAVALPPEIQDAPLLGAGDLVALAGNRVARDGHNRAVAALAPGEPPRHLEGGVGGRPRGLPLAVVAVAAVRQPEGHAGLRAREAPVRPHEAGVHPHGGGLHALVDGVKDSVDVDVCPAVARGRRRAEVDGTDDRDGRHQDHQTHLHLASPGGSDMHPNLARPHGTVPSGRFLRELGEHAPFSLASGTRHKPPKSAIYTPFPTQETMETQTPD